MSIAQQPPKETARVKPDLAYVIQSVDGQRIVKVGRSASPIQRIKGIRCGVPFDVELVAILVDGARREREMKSLLSECKVKGEWFAPDERLNSYLVAASNSKAVVHKVDVDESFFSDHILPLALDYLNGREPALNDPGDFVYRVIHAGFDAAKGRLAKLLKACPNTFTPELLAGYIPVSFGSVPPKVFLPSSTPSEAA